MGFRARNRGSGGVLDLCLESCLLERDHELSVHCRGAIGISHRDNGSFKRAHVQILNFLYELADSFNQFGCCWERG
jgi:hypothetical protein